MTVQYEPFYVEEILFNRAYSDKGMKIHGGVPKADYDEASDPVYLGRIYTETNIPINSGDSIVEDKAVAHDILVGEIQ